MASHHQGAMCGASWSPGRHRPMKREGRERSSLALAARRLALSWCLGQSQRGVGGQRTQRFRSNLAEDDSFDTHVADFPIAYGHISFHIFISFPEVLCLVLSLEEEEVKGRQRGTREELHPPPRRSTVRCLFRAFTARI